MHHMGEHIKQSEWLVGHRRTVQGLYVMSGADWTKWSGRGLTIESDSAGELN